MADRYDMLELVPTVARVDAVRKSDARMRRLTAAQSRLFTNKILRSIKPRLLVQSPPGSGKTVLCQHLALEFLASQLDTEAAPDAPTLRFLLLTHGAALAKQIATYIEMAARESLGIRLNSDPVDALSGAIVLRLNAPPTEIHVVPIDVLVAATTGVNHRVPRLFTEKLWPRDKPGPFHQVAVDEGHLVFSHQPLSHLDGQHLLRNCEDVCRVVEAVMVPGCRMTIFHDEDYQGAGVPVSYPMGCDRLTAGLAMVRCPCMLSRCATRKGVWTMRTLFHCWMSATRGLMWSSSTLRNPTCGRKVMAYRGARRAGGLR